MKFPENFKVVPVGNYLDISGTVYTDSINMKGYHAAAFLIQIGTLGTASATLTVQSGAADATYTTPETFDYAFAGAAATAANCDVLADSASAATLALTHGTYSDHMLVVEIDASAMTEGQEWLALKFVEGSSGTGNVTVFAILEPRYTGNRSATAVHNV